MLKVLQARLQKFVNSQMLKLVLEKAEESDQIANMHWIIEKAKVPEKHLFLLY